MSWLVRLTALIAALANVLGAEALTAETLNGTYQGRHLPEWNQDLFLGVPFAQPPVGELRYRWPQSLNASFQETRDATEYGYSCMQYAAGAPLNMSEDCLTLNIVRPSGSTKPLPVLVWIYGGGLGVGATADPQYNVSGIVKVSQDMREPVIGVSINYRVSHWGFLQSPEVLAEGSTNAGLLDQRMALQWLQENIAAFGGDPDRVVVWGESAGAQSIMFQMLAYDGRDDGLFRGAILESGGPTGTPVKDLSYWAVPFENLTRSVGCLDASDRLDCLRGVSQEDLYAARQSQEWQGPLIDGTFLTGYPSELMPEGKFVKVPVITGANTDEGISFHPRDPKPDTEVDIFNGFMPWRSYTPSPQTLRKLLQLYPDDPCSQPPHSITNCSVFPSNGQQWRRAASIGGDMVMVASRRKTCEFFAEADQPVYSYRFDTRLWNRGELDGVQHFDNVAFSFQNITGLLGPSPKYDSHRRMAVAIGQAYVNFVNSLDPNPRPRRGACGMLPRWPRYSLEQPTNMVLNASGSFVEPDTFRKEGIAFINSAKVSRELLG